MIRVLIDSIRVSLISQHRVVVLKEQEGERFLPIWIGPYEADAITISLQGIHVARPLTHDLLKNLIEAVRGTVTHVVVTNLRDETFYATIMMEVDGDTVEVDSRPSDAIALAVRVGAPIFVDEEVMTKAGIEREPGQEDAPAEDDDNLDVFKDFVESLDLDDLLGDEGTR